MQRCVGVYLYMYVCVSLRDEVAGVTKSQDLEKLIIFFFFLVFFFVIVDGLHPAKDYGYQLRKI